MCAMLKASFTSESDSHFRYYNLYIMPTQRKFLKQIVRRKFTQLRSNLQVKGILAELFNEGVIESDQKIKLQEISVPEDAADKFLDDLFQRVDERMFHSFIHILAESGDVYPNHLEMAELLQQSLQEAIPQNVSLKNY